MKSLKIMAASLLAVASFASAFADVNIKVTGSTAFRKAFYFAAVNSINSPKIACIGGKTDASDMSGANRAVITGTGKVGTAYAGQNVTIQCGFAGSIGGLTALVTPLNTIPLSGFTDAAHTWMSASNAAASGASVANSGTGKITGYVNFTSESGVAFDGAAFPTVSMSDSFITSTPVVGSLTPSEDNPAHGVGIVAFDWNKGQNSSAAPAGYARLTNVTTLQANLLLAAGELPLSFFTGNSGDTGVDVLFVGRNNDSGTRLDTEAEADYGYGFSSENQYQPVIAGGVITGVTNVGDAGYSSGSSVAAALATVQGAGAVDDAGNPFIFVSYLGKGDSATVKAANANSILSFNGVKYDQADDMIRYGAYSGWSYEHCLYTATDSPTVKNKSLISDIVTRLTSTDAVQGGVLNGTMQVSRFIEGGVISP